MYSYQRTPMRNHYISPLKGMHGFFHPQESLENIRKQASQFWLFPVFLEAGRVTGKPRVWPSELDRDPPP